MHFIFNFLLFFIIQSDDELRKRLPPCPDSPNCVNSVYTADRDHYMKPIDIEGDVENTRNKLLKILKADKNISVTSEQADLIRAEFLIPVFGFVDDVIFYLDHKNNIIHFRSSSRVGYYDFGVNRNRIKRIKRKLCEE